MKTEWAGLTVLAAWLSTMGVQAAESLRAFGLEVTVISNAVIAVEADYPVLSVIQVGGPSCEDYGSGNGSNDVENVPFGVSVHLGEADSGIYIYPDASCRANGRSMWGNAFGSIDGVTNKPISSIRGTRLEWGVYRVDVDLTPLGATSYTYQVWSHGIQTLKVTKRCLKPVIVNTLNIEDYNPRANPIHLTAAGPAALIEFPNGTHFTVADLDGSDIAGPSAHGDRMLVIAEGVTNHVDYVSRVDVFGSANLPSFAINDARLGMFGRPHKALGGVNFDAVNGRLRAGPFDGAITEGPTNGILVDFKNGATRWVARTEPFAFEQGEAQLTLSASGIGSSDAPYERYWGPVGFTKSNKVVRLAADFSGLDTSGAVLRVFHGNELSGIIHGSNDVAFGSLSETNPLVTGWAASGNSLSISIAESTRLIGHDGTLLEGDRFEFAPDISPIRFGSISSADVRMLGTAQVTIVSETTEEARVPEMRMQIERASQGLVVSWPYHPGFYALGRTNLNDDYATYLPAEYRDFRWYAPVNPTNRMQFFSLRHQYSYYITP
jgi:hypothetical protein